MATVVQCPYCGNYNTMKTKNGKLSRNLSSVGCVLGGALLEMATGGGLGFVGSYIATGRMWHQYYCRDCSEAFKVRLGVAGNVLETKKY